MDETAVLSELKGLVSDLEAHLREPDVGDPDALAGTSAAAAENRAMRASRFLMARQRAQAVSEELAATRRRARAMARDARATRRNLDPARTDEASGPDDALEESPVPLGVGIPAGPHDDEPTYLGRVMTEYSGFEISEAGLAAGLGQWLLEVLDGSRVDLGTFDHAVVARLAALGAGDVQTIAGWIARSRPQLHHGRRPPSGTASGPMPFGAPRGVQRPS